MAITSPPRVVEIIPPYNDLNNILVGIRLVIEAIFGSPKGECDFRIRTLSPSLNVLGVISIATKYRAPFQRLSHK